MNKLAFTRLPKVRTLFIGSFLFSFGVAVNLYYGRRGFMPYDQSILFDGGWRVLCGQAPFRDFTTAAGVTPLLMQAVFFQIFGISWFSYCLHAAVINGIFCVLVYWFLRSFHLSRFYAIIYGLCSGVVFYPPMGTPYFEEHAFFFIFLTLVVIRHVQITSSPFWRRVSWGCVPFLFLCAFLSKQNAALFGLVPIGLLSTQSFRTWKTTRVSLEWVLVGSCACGFLLVGIIYLYGIEWRLIFLYFLKLPYQVGRERLSFLATSRQVGSIVFLALIVTPLVVSMAGLAIGMLMMRHWRQRIAWTSVFFQVVLALGLILECLYLIVTTNNQMFLGFPYIFVGLGLVHCGVLVSTHVSLTKIRLSSWLGVVFLLIALRDASYFMHYVNASRIVNELVFDPQHAHQPCAEKLRFMRFQVPERYYHYLGKDLDQVLVFFETHEGNFLVIGDTTILYGLTGRPSLLPSLWYHVGLTVPLSNTSEFEAYQQRLLQNLQQHQIRYIVVENGSLAGMSVDCFPKLLEYFNGMTFHRHLVGGFMIGEILDNE